MKRIWLLLVVAMLTACASSGGSTDGGAPIDASRAHATAKARTELAAAYYERNQYVIALQELSAALQADSDYAPAYAIRALIRMALHEDELADKDFRQSLYLDDSSSNARNNYGWFLCQRGREKESLKQFKLALKDPLYTTPEMAYTNLGVCSQKAGLLEEAEINLQRALALRSDMQEALYGLADLNYVKGDFARAKSFFLRFYQTVRELNAEQLWLAVRIERKMRDRNSEASYALQLRKRYPDSREAQLLMQGK